MNKLAWWLFYLDSEKKATVVTKQEADSFLRLGGNFRIDQNFASKQLSIL